MRILAIETSCDETGISIVDAEGNLSAASFKVLANFISSQTELHAKYGGVFPMLAKREHGKNLVPLLKAALTKAGLLKSKPKKIHSQILKNIGMIFEREPELCKAFLEFVPNIEKPPIDSIAVTYGPGLEPALWVGINFAKALALTWKIPVIAVNHMEGHIFSALLVNKNSPRKIPSYDLRALRFPALALLISGGHTELVLMRKWFKYEIIGQTRDDAVGEAFDKVARLLGLSYPGGPEISKLAQQGNPGRVKLPRPMLKSGNFDFSFAGLKTAVLYTMKKLPYPRDQDKANIAREFEQAVTDVLASKTIAAVKKYKVKTLVLGGGVSANIRIRETINNQISKKIPSVKIYLPESKLTTDNSLMIGVAGYFRHKTKKLLSINADGNASLEKI